MKLKDKLNKKRKQKNWDDILKKDVVVLYNGNLVPVVKEFIETNKENLVIANGHVKTEMLQEFCKKAGLSIAIETTKPQRAKLVIKKSIIEAVPEILEADLFED